MWVFLNGLSPNPPLISVEMKQHGRTGSQEPGREGSWKEEWWQCGGAAKWHSDGGVWQCVGYTMTLARATAQGWECHRHHCCYRKPGPGEEKHREHLGCGMESRARGERGNLVTEKVRGMKGQSALEGLIIWALTKEPVWKPGFLGQL